MNEFVVVCFQHQTVVKLHHDILQLPFALVGTDHDARIKIKFDSNFYCPNSNSDECVNRWSIIFPDFDGKIRLEPNRQ